MLWSTVMNKMATVPFKVQTLACTIATLSFYRKREVSVPYSITIATTLLFFSLIIEEIGGDTLQQQGFCLFRYRCTRGIIFFLRSQESRLEKNASFCMQCLYIMQVHTYYACACV